MRAIDPNFLFTSPQTIALLRQFLDMQPPKTFDEIRSGVGTLSLVTDGEINQAVQDAGFIVADNSS